MSGKLESNIEQRGVGIKRWVERSALAKRITLRKVYHFTVTVLITIHLVASNNTDLFIFAHNQGVVLKSGRR